MSSHISGYMTIYTQLCVFTSNATAALITKRSRLGKLNSSAQPQGSPTNFPSTRLCMCVFA